LHVVLTLATGALTMEGQVQSGNGPAALDLPGGGGLFAQFVHPTGPAAQDLSPGKIKALGHSQGKIFGGGDAIAGP
jgi:hypothetical protein